MIAALVVLALVVVAALAGGIAVTAVRQKRSFASANEIVPGRPTSAPASWAGAHSPEAKLHRRIGAAVAALHANTTLADGAFMESRAAIEQHAVAIDERLIAGAALPAGHREAAIASIEPEVVRLEASIAALADPAPGATSAALDDSLRAAQIRLDALAEARAEIDALDGPSASSELPVDIPAEAPPAAPVERPAAQTQPPQPPAD